MSSPTASSVIQAAPAPARPAGDPVLSIEHVSVRYRVPRERIHSFKDFAIRWMKRKIVYDEFWALRDVSLDVRPREVLGIIGHNGAGKSTLLKLIARVLQPTEGRVVVRGRVAPLLELGAGFDAELTGRENVYLNGAVLGFRKADIAERFDRIVDFSGLRDFIDMPLRTYSTGMSMRLGFAVATDIQPEILILDEVLSVGDEAFQAKCQKRMEGFRASGVTSLVVTHSMDTVLKLCTRAAWLDHGIIKTVGSPSEVVQAYRKGK